MNQHKFSVRLISLLTLAALLFTAFFVRLYAIQVVQAGKMDPNAQNTITYYTRVKAARGEILDRNGNVLVGNRASFNLLIVREVLYSSGSTNEYLRKVANLCKERGLEYADHLPVSKTKPYEYTFDNYSAQWKGYFNDYLLDREWDSDISAPQLVKRMMSRYNIPEDWTEEEARQVISLRYELDLRALDQSALSTYVLLEDVDSGALAELKELNVPGMTVESSTVREYHTQYAAHILGRVGPMDSDEWETYKELDYKMDAIVGKDGLEKAFEAELHGVDGTRETTVSTDGTILEEHYIDEPIAGNNVELTIDLNYQQVAENALEELILNLRRDGIGSRGEGKDAKGGAMVVMKVKTGEVLVSASYPTFDITTYSEKFNELKEAEYDPLFDRALLGEYPPGSIFKMVTTIAAIDSGAITRETTVYDKGIYERFADVGYTPRCMLYTTSGATHGTINVMQAISVSCNYFFYEAGWLTGIDRIDATAKALGLGEHTGVELVEYTGHRANPETKKALYTGDYSAWYGGDTISAAIGQSEHLYTPMQLCSYTCALANKGVRYKATFLKRVISADYQQLLKENEPTVLSKLDISDEAYAAYSDGMRLAVTAGSCNIVFGSYPVAVCAKTGTAQHGEGGSDNASYVLYAPQEDPEIAIMVYVERGAQGGNLGRAAKKVLDAYYSETNTVDTVPAENRIN